MAPVQQKDFEKQRGVKGGRAREGVRVIQILMFRSLTPHRGPVSVKNVKWAPRWSQRLALPEPQR